MPAAALLALRHDPAPALEIVNPTTATAGGYTVEIERGLVERRATAAARFTAPDGRVLNVSWDEDTARLMAALATAA